MTTILRKAVHAIDKCQELGASLGFYKWEPHDEKFIQKIKDQTFDYLGARDQTRILELVEVLRGSH